jgi:hypothetical protein
MALSKIKKKKQQHKTVMKRPHCVYPMYVKGNGVHYFKKKGARKK